MHNLGCQGMILQPLELLSVFRLGRILQPEDPPGHRIVNSLS